MANARDMGQKGRNRATWPSPIWVGLQVQGVQDSPGLSVKGKSSFQLPPALIFFSNKIQTGLKQLESTVPGGVPNIHKGFQKAKEEIRRVYYQEGKLPGDFFAVRSGDRARPRPQ